MAVKLKACAGCHAEKPVKDFAKTEFCPLCRASGAKEAPPPPESPVVVIDEAEIAALQPFPVAEADYTNPSIQELAARTLARRKLMQFIKRFKPKYTAGWVHEDICRRLEQFMKDVEDMKEPRLLLMVPVRHGKSEIASRHFPAWVLGKHPDWEIIAASGAQSLALSFSRYIRDLVRDPSFQSVFPNLKLDATSQSVENWNSTQGGGYLAAGIGTMITGRGSHILIIDDPVKDAEAADSQTQRDNTWEWYMSTAYTRLAPGGGVLGIMCMTGDTPVLMADGTQRRLDSLKASDEIATYARGRLARTTVAAVKACGRDYVLKITMSSGKIVRANQRHPFLTVAPSGELSWTRLKNLNTRLKIVVVKGSGGSGKGLPVQQKGARSQPSAEVFASRTTSNRSGPLDTVAQALQILRSAALRASSTVMGLLLLSTTLCLRLREGCALSAANHQATNSLSTGEITSPSITATTPVRLEGCCATTATPGSDILLMSRWHLPPRDTSDFTLDEIVSIEPDGVEEVFDVQVDRTENFIANGLVSHNTWWNDDDWAGRVQQSMATGDGDMFEIVKYPAINELGDEYILPDDSIEQFPPDSTIPEGARMTRPHMTALHPERYTLPALLRRKASYYAMGQQRWWSALYQQNPSPEEGAYFTKKMFRVHTHRPPRINCVVFQAWDFAITEGQANDWTVCATIMQDENDLLFVLDIKRFKCGDGIDIMETVVDHALVWKPDVLGFEDGQIWKSLESTFTKTCAAKGYYPSYEVLKPFTDKFVRAQPLRGRMQAGKVSWPEHAGWFEALRQEFLRFGAGGTHDDQVDAMAWAVRLTLAKTAPRPVSPPKEKSWRDRLKGLMAGQGGESHMAS